MIIFEARNDDLNLLLKSKLNVSSLLAITYTKPAMKTPEQCREMFKVNKTGARKTSLTQIGNLLKMGNQ